MATKEDRSLVVPKVAKGLPPACHPLPPLTALLPHLHLLKVEDLLLAALILDLLALVGEAAENRTAAHLGSTSEE